jgi:hypothetical protein
MVNASYSKFKSISKKFLCLLYGACLVSPALAGCYNTPSEAVAADAVNSSSPSSSVVGGYRVIRVHSDPMTGERWAIVVRCGHPEWPAFALQEYGSIITMQRGNLGSEESIPTTLVVRAGDTVRLWKQESLLRIEVAGISEESGSLGKIIKVRLLFGNTANQSIAEQLSGIIRGPSDVEMQP